MPDSAPADPAVRAPAAPTRRRVLAGLGTVAAGGALWLGAEAATPSATVWGLGIDVELPRPPVLPAAPALALRYPWLWHGAAPRAEVQWAHAVRTPVVLEAGEGTFRAADGARIVPWAPLFARGPAFAQAPESLRRLCGARRLWLRDEGSDTVPVLGNKARKYELLLPALAAAGVERLYTHGAYGSNHCAHLALALSQGGVAPTEWRPRLAAGVYPQPLTRAVGQKLKLLATCAERLELLDSDAQVGVSMARRLWGTHKAPGPEAYVPAGGSTPLSVFGHVDALMELAAALDGEAPPDVIVLPLGSGATSMGVVLGCHLLGWRTRVQVAPTQDRSALVRLLVNRDASAPFALPHAVALLDAALGWARRFGLPVDVGGTVTAAELVARHLDVARDAWRPAYGELSPEAERLRVAADRAGVVLDPTFTGKSFAALCASGEGGALRSASVLLWNTYQRFDLGRLLPPGDAWLERFPTRLAAQLAELGV